MKIALPNQIDFTDFNDGEKMIIGLMYLISNRYGYDHWYNINAGDFRKIVFHRAASNPAVFGPKTEKLREVFDFAQLDKNNICIKFHTIKPKVTHVNRKGFNGIGSTLYELKDFRSIKIWCYLMGQWFGGNEIVNDSKTLIEYDTSKRSATNLEYKNFLVG